MPVAPAVAIPTPGLLRLATPVGTRVIPVGTRVIPVATREIGTRRERLVAGPDLRRVTLGRRTAVARRVPIPEVSVPVAIPGIPPRVPAGNPGPGRAGGYRGDRPGPPGGGFPGEVPGPGGGAGS